MATSPEYLEHRAKESPILDDRPSDTSAVDPGDSVVATPPGRQPTNTISKTSQPEIVQAEYSRPSANIKEYLALDIYSINCLEASEGSRDLTDEKRAVLMLYQQLKDYDAAIPASRAIFPLLYTIGINTSVGVSLNLEPATGSGLVTILLFLMIFVIPTISTIGYLNLPIEISADLARVRGGHTVIGGVGGESDDIIELTEFTTTRRTATGLAEEGRARGRLEH